MLNSELSCASRSGQWPSRSCAGALTWLRGSAVALAVALPAASLAQEVAPVVGGMPQLSAPVAGPVEDAPAAPAVAADAAPVSAPAPQLSAPAEASGGAPAAAPQPGAAEPPVTGAAPEAATPAGTESTPAGTGSVTDASPASPGAGSGAAPAADEVPAAPQPVVTPAEPADAVQPVLHDLSPMGMYEAADIVVKAVMIGLALASALTWTVLLVKLLELAGAGRRLRRSVKVLRNAGTLQDARDASARHRGPASFMIREVAQEYQRSYPAVAEAGPDGMKERSASVLSRIEAQAVRRMQRGTGLLASIGSLAPFIGLFGTVWGIMNSFIGIAQSQTTNLAVVAPGIAEALLATAIGLVAAIPAVLFYNSLARAISGYRLKLADAGAGVQRLVSRDLDFRVEPRVPGRTGR